MNKWQKIFLLKGGSIKCVKRNIKWIIKMVGFFVSEVVRVVDGVVLLDEECVLVFTQNALEYDIQPCKPNTEYTFVIDTDNNSTFPLNMKRYDENKTFISSGFIALMQPEAETKVTFTTLANQYFLKVEFFEVDTWSVPTVSEIAKFIAIYEGDKTVTKPTSGIFESGNSYINRQGELIVIESDLC